MMMKTQKETEIAGLLLFSFNTKLSQEAFGPLEMKVFGFFLPFLVTFLSVNLAKLIVIRHLFLNP